MALYCIYSMSLFMNLLQEHCYTHEYLKGVFYSLIWQFCFVCFAAMEVILSFVLVKEICKYFI